MGYLTDKLQFLADGCAKKHGFYAATYVGPKDGVLVFMPIMQSSGTLHDGPTGIIIIEHITAEYISTNDNDRLMYYFNFLTSSDAYVGRGVRAYESLLRRLDGGKLPKKDVEYANYIKEWGPKPIAEGECIDHPYNPITFFVFFDVAKRLEKKLEFIPKEDGSCEIKILD